MNADYQVFLNLAGGKFANMFLRIAPHVSSLMFSRACINSEGFVASQNSRNMIRNVGRVCWFPAFIAFLY